MSSQSASVVQLHFLHPDLCRSSSSAFSSSSLGGECSLLYQTLQSHSAADLVSYTVKVCKRCIKTYCSSIESGEEDRWTRGKTCPGGRGGGRPGSKEEHCFGQMCFTAQCSCCRLSSLHEFIFLFSFLFCLSPYSLFMLRTEAKRWKHCKHNSTLKLWIVFF